MILGKKNETYFRRKGLESSPPEFVRLNSAIPRFPSEAEYTYPVIESDYLQIWPVRTFDPYYPYGYGPYYYWPYGDPWYPYYYGYYGPYPFFPFIAGPHRHHAWPSAPSHFRNGRHR